MKLKNDKTNPFSPGPGSDNVPLPGHPHAFHPVRTLQKSIRFTTDLTKLGTLKYEETKPTILPPQPPQSAGRATTSDDSPAANDKANFHDISD